MSVQSDFNTGGFTFGAIQFHTIDIQSTSCVVRYAKWEGIRMRGLLRTLTKRIDASRVKVVPRPTEMSAVKDDRQGSTAVTHAWLWPRLADYLREDDIVVTETGTANFGILDTTFPAGVTALSQVLWGSIGWSVGACLGAVLAARDRQQDRRCILFVGDGSLQLTVQELSPMIRQGLKPVMSDLPNPRGRA